MGFLQLSAQNKPINYLLESTSALSSDKTMPFWLTSNTRGQVPNSNVFQVHTALFSDFSTVEDKFDISYKAAFTAYAATTNELFVDELYLGLRYNKLQLHLGVKQGDLLWNGISSSNGNLAMSNNARSFPGYNFLLADFVYMPFLNNKLAVKASYGDFLLNDDRVVDNARLHAKSLVFKTVLSNRLDLITGLYHYAQWAGTSAEFGKQPSGFKNYLKIVTGSVGGDDAAQADQNNVLGNHLGTYLLQFNYKGDKQNWSFYWSHLFEDASGRELANFPDALYGLNIDFKAPEGFVSHLLTEFTYTKSMSGGSNLDRRARDDYFNNGVYESGWTYFGNTIGSPYFTPKAIDENGVTKGVIKGDNRFIAFNVGVKGALKAIKYKALLSHVTYFGWFDNEYDPSPQQFSGLLELILSEGKTIPFDIIVGTAFDTGTYRSKNLGGFIKLSKNGIF